MGNGIVYRRQVNGPKATKLVLTLVGSIFALIGAIFLCVGIIVQSNVKKLEQRCTARTEGVVVEMIAKEKYDEDTRSTSYMWYPVFEYTVEGETLTQYSHYGTNPPMFYEGEIIEMYYNPDKINEYFVPGQNVQMVFSIFIIIGGVFFGIGLIILIIRVFVLKSNKHIPV